MTIPCLPLRTVLIHLGIILLCGLVGIAIVTFDNMIIIGGLCFLVLVGLMFRWPEIGTLFIVFYIYANLAVILRDFHDVPDLAAAFFPLLLFIPLINYIIIRREKIIIDNTSVLMFLYFVVLITSSLFMSKDIRISIKMLINYSTEGLAIYILMINVIRNYTTWRRVLWTLMLTGSLFGVISLYQAVTNTYDNQYGGFAMTGIIERRNKDFGKAYDHLPERRSERAQGAVGEPNRYAQTMIVLVPLSLFLFWTARSRWAQIGAVMGGICIIWGIMLSFSRSGFLTLALMLLILTCLRHIRLSHLLVTAIVLGLFVTIAAPRYILRIASIGGVQSLYSDEAETEADGAITGRVTEMLSALTVFLDYPILGVGPGQYMPFYSVKYQLDADIAFRHIPIPRRAHSLYLEMAAETGLIGLGTFLTVVLALIAQLWREGRRWVTIRPDLSYLATAAWLSLLGYLVMGFFLHLSYQRYYWFLLALAGAALQIIRSQTSLIDTPPRAAVVHASAYPQTMLS